MTYPNKRKFYVSFFFEKYFFVMCLLCENFPSEGKTFFRLFLFFLAPEKCEREKEKNGGDSNIHLLPWQREYRSARDRTAWIFFFLLFFCVLFLSTSSTFARFSFQPSHTTTFLCALCCSPGKIFSGAFLRNTTHLIINTQTMTRFICFPSKNVFLFSHAMAGIEMMTMKRRLRSFFFKNKRELIWQTPWRILKIFSSLIFPNNCSFILEQCYFLSSSSLSSLVEKFIAWWWENLSIFPNDI